MGRSGRDRRRRDEGAFREGGSHWTSDDRNGLVGEKGDEGKLVVGEGDEGEVCGGVFLERF